VSLALYRLLAAMTAVSLLLSGAPAGDPLPYSQNRVVPVSFNVQGAWTVGEVAAKAETDSLSRHATRSLIGCRLNVQGTRVELRNKKNESWGKRFDTSFLGQQTYDTKSKEFWLDFRTDPEDLSLPRYVSAANVEIGTILAADATHVYFNYAGTWFHLTRAGSSTTL
jgi:hypothetical protein